MLQLQAPGTEIGTYLICVATNRGLVASIFFAFFKVFLAILFPLVWFALLNFVILFATQSPNRRLGYHTARGLFSCIRDLEHVTPAQILR